MSIRKRVGYLVPMGYWGANSMMREMERMADDLRAGFSEIMPNGGSSDRVATVDILDEGDRYVIEAELPGVKKEEVRVDVGEDSIAIEAKREAVLEEKKEGYVCKERERMTFYRELPIPEDGDGSKAVAKLENGLLTITMPKREKVAEVKRRLDIE
ncbi:MAG: Hsp20/alpha crystallin family protein [Methanomassiliicoccus sp.]|nr:Hsp20/alpha crystallin family protein [Methanomassiliicoccus sp.]